MTLPPVAILAGGLATRLHPLTERVPKALLEIAGRPFIFRQLELLARQGIGRVVLCVGHLGDQIRAVVGDGRELGLAVEYAFDGERLLGTGGALKKALPLLGDEFFVLNGDSYVHCSFRQIRCAYTAARQLALMTVLRNENRWDTSNVLFDAGVLIEYDKRSPRPDMAHIDYGVSIFSRAAFSGYARFEVFDLADLCRDLSLKGELAGFEVDQRFYEIGSPRGIEDAQEFFSREAGTA